MKKNTIYALLTWVVIIALLILFSAARNNRLGKAECPEKILGNVNASFTIKYFESPFCVYCWFQEPIIKDMIEEKGSLFSISYYDIRFCTSEVSHYSVPGTPTFVFQTQDKEFMSYGLIPKKDFENIICEASGGC